MRCAQASAAISVGMRVMQKCNQFSYLKSLEVSDQIIFPPQGVIQMCTN